MAEVSNVAIRRPELSDGIGPRSSAVGNLGMAMLRQERAERRRPARKNGLAGRRAEAAWGGRARDALV
jgi:hypothetical protein